MGRKGRWQLALVTLQLLALAGFNSGRVQAQQAAQAQAAPLVAPDPHQGYYLSLGVHGIGAYADDSDLGGLGPGLGVGGSLRVGQALTAWLDLGIGLAFAGTWGDDPLSVGRLTMESQWYFADRWFARAALGLGIASGEDPAGDDDPGRAGDVYVLGVGRQLFLTADGRSGGWALTPTALIELGPGEDLLVGALWLGIELSYWTGLERGQLKLPLDRAYDPAQD